MCDSLKMHNINIFFDVNVTKVRFMSKSKQKKTNEQKLPRECWAVNFSNLFERGAYYGMTAIAAYHFRFNIGIPAWIVGLFLTISMVMINFLPLISTALASKYGFKKILLASYTTLFIGYIFLGFGHTVVLVGLAYVVMGLGSGFEKALIAASISHSSNEENRIFAFNVYYMVINIGAAAVPVSLWFLFAPADYGGVFFLMSLFVACSFIIILTSYKNPVEPDPSVPALKAVKELKIIFGDPRFAMVLIIFAGCWFMLYTRMALIPMYVPYFGILPDAYIVFLAALNPATVVAITPFWSKFVKKRNVDSLKLLIMGIIFISLGFIMIGFTLNPLVLILGIIVLSFGELVSYPSFLTYVSKIPPKEKRSIYMGYSFFPLFLAGVFGPSVGGALYYHFGEGMKMGAMVWSIIACVGLVAASAFMHYDRIYNQKIKAKSKRKGIFQSLRRSPFISKINSTIPIFFIPIILIFASTVVYESDEEEIKVLPQIEWIQDIKTFSMRGKLDETETFSQKISLPDNANITHVYLNLSWDDEPDIRRLRRFENKGDTFEARITIDQQVVAKDSNTNPHGEKGIINLRYNSDESNDRNVRSIYAKIELVDCGDFYPAFGLGLILIEDSSNSYELEIDVIYNIPKILD